jgi:hypothetical protein
MFKLRRLRVGIGLDSDWDQSSKTYLYLVNNIPYVHFGKLKNQASHYKCVNFRQFLGAGSGSVSRIAKSMHVWIRNTGDNVDQKETCCLQVSNCLAHSYTVAI